MRLLSGSLVARLSRRLIVLQLLTLTVFAIFAAIPPSDRRSGMELDDRVLDVIARNITGTSNGMDYEHDADLSALMTKYPNFWFYVRATEGLSVQYGPAPEQIRRMFDTIASATYAEIRWESSAPDLGVVARRMNSPAGLVSIVTGGGPAHHPFVDRLLTVSSYYPILLALMTAATALSIPVLLRKEFRGVARVADEAKRIDVDRRGARLTATDVPVEMQGLVRAVNLALSRLDEGLEKRQRFLAAAAHELRTPISILTTRIDLLPAGQDRNRLLLDVARLASLADQLLDLQRLDSDFTRQVPVDLSALVSEVTMDIAPLAIAAGAGISLDVPSGTVMIEADRHAIARVVTNLVQNAIVHGGSNATIEVEVARPAELRVRDNGPGIVHADRAQIFEPFFRRSAGGSGAGLGLNLVQEIVARHGGAVQVTDAPQGGAEFVVRFPPVGTEVADGA